ncbi:MAG: hypothetical protein CVU60_10260 [Deltaproteobacteria bacterium HGW-Deltaproteobacteria-18]|nr:MAG: hypothetical protein CVU60_10260 [Deltaproteobacteria bacterium HGW-Deltaproteobacteria-18]
MPAGNGTGPMGMGSMTGRGAGYCSGSGTPGYATGGGFGFCGGRGRGRRFFATAPQGRFARQGAIDPAAEQQALKNQVEALQSQLKAIQERLAEMK